MKALEILKRLDNSDYFDKSKLGLDKEYTLDKAIEELEALQNRTCDTCKHTKTVWFWRVNMGNGVCFLTEYMYTEEEIKEKYPDVEYTRLDILGSEEVEI